MLTGIAMFCLFVNPDPANGDYNGAQLPIFFGARPDAGAEATGGDNVSLGGSLASGIYNPAGLGSITGFAASTSMMGSSFPVNEDLKFDYFSGAVQVGTHGVFAVSRYHSDCGIEITETDGSGDSTGVHTPTSSLYSLTYASELFGNLLGGCSLNLIEDKLTSDRTEYSVHVDLGVIESLELVRNGSTEQDLNLGASLMNATFSTIYSDEELPVSLRLGLSYRLAWKKELFLPDLNAVEFTLRSGYTEILNSPDSRGFRIGVEALIMEMLAVRYGHIHDKLAFGEFASSIEYENAASFGFGLRLPIHKLILESLPLEIRLDMAWLELPDPHIQDADNYTVSTLSVNLLN